MKPADYYEQGSPRKNLSIRLPSQLWWILLVGLSIAGLGSLGLWFWNQRSQLDASYRYQFSESSASNVTLALGQEVAFYQQRISRSPKDGLDRAALAGTYLQMARATGDANWYLLAEQSARRSLANLPFNNEGAMLVLARVAEAKHDFAESIQLAEQVLKLQPGNDDALSILVTSNLAMGKLEAADRAARTLASRVPTLTALTLQALVKVAQGQDQAAIEYFQQAIAAEEPGEAGSSAWARTLFGRFYFERGNLVMAKELYREALRILPRYPLALVNLAELEIRLGHYQAAERSYAKVFVSPDYPSVFDHVAWQGMAWIKELQGDRSGAAERWQDAETLLRRHQSVNAFGHRRELARLLLAQGHTEDLPEALSLMQAEVKVRRDAETLDTLAWALAQSGRWPEAQQAIQETIERGTRDAGIFYRAGTIEQALGNRAQATTFFQMAEATDPTFNQQAQQMMGLATSD